MPHLATIDRMRAFLKKTACVMTVCGYSFGDEHLNEVIVQGLQGNPTASVFAFLHGDLKKYPSIVTIAKTRPNLNILARDEAIVGTKIGNWTKGKAATSCQDSIAVKWLPDPTQPSLKDATFKLGDFATLAAFAEDLTGDRQRFVRP